MWYIPEFFICWSSSRFFQCNSLPVYSGAQPEIFQGRGGLVGLGHIYKHFVKNTRKKAAHGNIWWFFLLDTLKTTFWMENVTQRWTQSGHFLQNQGTFFAIFKIGEGRPPLPPPSCAPDICDKCPIISQYYSYLDLMRLLQRIESIYCR